MCDLGYHLLVTLPPPRLPLAQILLCASGRVTMPLCSLSSISGIWRFIRGLAFFLCEKRIRDFFPGGPVVRT